MNLRQITKVLTIFVFAIGLSANAQNKDAVKKASESYKSEGQKLMTALKGGKATDKEIDDITSVMIKDAQIVMKEYAAKYKEASKLVDHLIGKTEEMKKLSFDKLQADYHDAAALTKDVVGMDLKDEKNEKFLDPCHILIHPMMVRAAFKEKKSKDAIEELNEGMEQMEASNKELSK